MSLKNSECSSHSKETQAKANEGPDSKPTINSLKQDLKLVEAKTAVILLKTTKLYTKNEYTQWLLKILYQPRLRQDNEYMNVVYLSRSRRRIWTTDFSINQEQSKGHLIHKNNDQLYVITPKTTIMTVAQENRIVYIVDLSSSLATIGDTQSDILLSEAYRTLRDSLEGLVQPFSMQVSPTEKAVFQPSIRITVIADYSQFASNINIIPVLVEHPTMRVFMQNVVITASNIQSIIKKLKSEFLVFQHDTAQFRKVIKKTRNAMGYNLDVGSKTDPAVTDVLDATSFSSKHRQSVSMNNGQNNRTDETTKCALSSDASEAQTNTDQSTKETTYSSSKKEVWGVGKSGANLSRILHAGHFALKLIPQEGTARLVLITDGTMKSNVHDNTFVRQFAEKDITCHIIQVGGSGGFFPGKNFGFVPDSEILKFLARATNGTFMYSEKCPQVTSANPASFDKERHQLPSMRETTQPVVQFVDLNQCKNILNPNIYHHRFLFRETTFTKTYNEARLATDSDHLGNMRRESSNERRETLSNFPWDPYAKAPEEEWRLLKYREYVLPSEFSHIIAARAREGFMVQSVTFDDGTGSRQVDPDILDLETKDLSTMKKERVQIVMTMHWQSNVMIEYRIRATWLPIVIGGSSSYNSEALLMSSGIFSRAKAPRAEIYVRTDVSFAHMLQNWDVFKRRAQMMGVVTGNIYFGETYAAPVYTKIEKLKKYLMDIYEGDELLRSTIVFPCKFWMNVSTVTESAPNSLPSSLWPTEQTSNGSFGKYHLAHQQELFTESFRIFWDRINAAETRARTRCWYDPGCIDLLVGNVSPFMAPKLSSIYNQDFVNNVEGNIQVMINNVRSLMEDWADFVGEDGTFVKMIHKITTGFSTSHDDTSKEAFIHSEKLPPSFCELRVRHEYGRLITLRLLFFNVEVLTRRKVTENLVHSLKTSPLTAVPCNMICQRPFSSLLMRDPKHFSNNSVSLIDPSNQEENTKIPDNISKNQSRSKSWYLPFTTWLTSEYIVHDYLHHTTWSWQTDRYDDKYHKHNKMMPIHDLAFQFLCQARLDQGYELVSPRKDSIQFYQEIKLPAVSGKHDSLCAIQYFVWKDANTGKITTELWIEPAGEFDVGQYERVKKWTFEPDRSKISQLVTFDQIHAIGRSKVIGEFKDKTRDAQTIEDYGNNHSVMLLPQLFDVSSVLRSSKFIVASFKCPKFEVVPHFHQAKLQLILPQQDETEKTYGEGNGSNASTAPNTPSIRTKSFIRTQRYLRRNINHSPSDFTMNLSLPPEEQNLFTLKPDSLLSGSAKSITELNISLQSYAIHHYFVERSLEHISSGEINMSHHNLGASFWNELKNALCKQLGDRKLTSTSLITDLRKTRCFVKVFDPRSFVITLYPHLDSVTNSLLKLQKDNASHDLSELGDIKYTDLFLFECIRQKPMRPAKEGVTPESSGYFSVENTMEDVDKLTIKPIDFLIHESDGLGEMLRPTLYEGHFNSCQTYAQLSERTLRVSQDVVKNYSKSFFNSFYASLTRGFVVSDNDLCKVMEVCHESSMEIDVTEFMNMMSMQKEESVGFSRNAQSTEAQGKFNAIFNQYFELVHTKTEKQINLFYYKPSFCRYNATNAQLEDSPEDNKVSFIVNLASHSRSPLLVKLLYAYKNTPKGKNSETVIPVNTLPTTYLDVTDIPGKKNADKSKELCNFPLVFKGKRALLRLVLLNMPKTESENNDLNNQSTMPPEAVESLARSMQSQPECYNSLSTEQQLALVEIESRVKWLLVEETLHGLLKAPIVSTTILEYVEKKLNKPTPYTCHNTSIVIPFRFVKRNTDSRRIFMKELEKDNYNNNTRYRLRRLGDYFYVSEDSVFNMGDESLYSNSNSPVTTENTHPLESETQCEDYCEGLGITLNAPKSKMDDEITLVDETDAPLCKRPLYWLIIAPRKSHIQIYYYSKIQTLAVSSEILNAVKEKIKNVEERTNRISLLNYLQETRICSAYLEAPASAEEAKTYSEDESDESLSSDEPSDTLTGANIKSSREYRSKFLPGQFSCPLVFVKRFPLHWRLQPNVSLKFLTSDVLRLFKVINRSNTFVIERDGSIVYCKIFEETAGDNNQASPNTVCSSPGQSERLKVVEDDSKTIASFNLESSTKRDLAGTTSTSPARTRTVSSSRTIGNESRELVVQIFGINLPPWVESEFIDMIENRLITQITLTEVQQFFARNSTSKPTLADVEFILPVWKAPTRREIMRIPRAVDNLCLLLHYFGQIIIADNIKPLNSPHIGDVLKSYYANMFYNENREIIGSIPKLQTDSQYDSSTDTHSSTVCFYYNCTKRVPGASTPLELLVGQGMTGLCVTLLDETGLPMSKSKREGSRNYNFDPETARYCLEQDFREVAAEDAYYHVALDFWTIGTVDGDALMQHLYDCFRQSLCDYFIEKIVSMDFSLILSDKKALQKAITAKSKGRLGIILRNKFVDSVLYTLKTASQMNSPTVYCMSKQIKTTPWCMDDLLRHLDATLRKLDIALRPVVACTPHNKEPWDSSNDFLTSNNEWVLYKDYEYLHQQKIQENIRLVAISGLQEFVEKFGNIPHSSAQERRLSVASFLESQKSTSRRNSTDSAITESSGQQRNPKNSRQDRSRASSTISNPGSIQKNGPQLDSKKHCFLVLTLNESNLSIYTYNWSESLSVDLFKNIASFAGKQETRIGILTNILHQKMGLFHHTEPIKDCVEKSVSTVEQNLRLLSANGTSSIIFSPSVSQNYAASPMIKKPSQSENPGMASTSTSRGSTRRSTESSILPLANMLDFKDTILFTPSAFRKNLLESHKHGESLHSSPVIKSKEQNAYFDKILQKSFIKNAELDQALMDSITNSVADTPFGKEFDTLRRHGQTFLEAFLRQSKVQSAHHKALKVYIKWRNRYGDPQAGLDVAEKLSRQDVSTIMRSSRVLHFCRTPIMFCDPEKDWTNLIQGTNTQQIANWYKEMADILISEYAAYLERADMQPIDFAKSEDDESQQVMVLSEFDFGKHLKANCSPAYLLGVFEGGSIICEIRMTGAFLSVTLYTLHRQYGRLDYRRFRPETRSKKRENFRKFEKNSAELKQMVHINSFVYDFHIRYLQKALDNPERIPINLDIMSFVRQLTQSNLLSSPFSKARIIRGLYHIQIASIQPATFFENLFKISTRCGFHNVLSKNCFLATSTSCSNPFFGKKQIKESNSKWKYTLVLCPSDEKDHKDGSFETTSKKSTTKAINHIAVEYFILVSNQEEMTPQNMTKKSWATDLRESNDFASLSSITLVDENYTATEIVHGAKSKIDDIVSEVTTTSKQIQNWDKLYSADLNTHKPGKSEFTELISNFEHIDITELDSNVASVFEMKLNWGAVLDTVVAITRNNAKHFYIHNNRHLLLYNARYMDFMIHLRVSQDRTIHGWLVTREKRTKGANIEGAEKDQVINLSKILYYYLWKVISNKNVA